MRPRGDSSVLNPTVIPHKVYPVPNFLEDKLKAQAAKKGLKGRAADRYTYGAMNHMGAMRGNQITAKGAAMQRKHDQLLGLSSLRAA